MQATQTPITLADYLRTSYHPDCDFVDGEIQERHLGEYPHSKLQAQLALWFGIHQREWRINPLIEQRIRVTTGRVRICDVCLLHATAPREAVTVTPPLLCIEILSPEDRLPRASKVLEDYRAMGVPNLWLIDPVYRAAYTFSATGLQVTLADRLEVPETPIYLYLPELFAALD